MVGLENSLNTEARISSSELPDRLPDLEPCSCWGHGIMEKRKLLFTGRPFVLSDMALQSVTIPA